MEELIVCPTCGVTHPDNWCPILLAYLQKPAMGNSGGVEEDGADLSLGCDIQGDDLACCGTEPEGSVRCPVCGFEGCGGSSCPQCNTPLGAAAASEPIVGQIGTGCAVANNDCTTREARPVSLRLPSGRSVALACGEALRLGREVGPGDVRGELSALPTVSRRHCEVAVSSDGRAVTVRDMGSTNGTRINDVRTLLSPGEMRMVLLPVTIYLGESVSVRFE